MRNKVQGSRFTLQLGVTNTNKLPGITLQNPLALGADDSSGPESCPPAEVKLFLKKKRLTSSVRGRAQAEVSDWD